MTTGSYSGFAEFAAGEGVRVLYEKNTAPGVFTLWGSSPNTATNTALTAPPPGLGAGEYITRVRWLYGQAAPGASATTIPRIIGRVINPDNTGAPVTTGTSIQAQVQVSGTYTAGSTTVSATAYNFNPSPPVSYGQAPVAEGPSLSGPADPHRRRRPDHRTLRRVAQEATPEFARTISRCRRRAPMR